MFNRKSGCAVFPAGLLASAAGVIVAISLAACQSDDLKKETAVRDTRNTSSAEMGSANDAYDAAHALPAEARHFAVYGVYRALFDEPVTETSGASEIIGNSMVDSAASISIGRAAEVGPTCSMRALIMQD